MINITQDIHPLTEFKKNTNEFIVDLKKTKRPAILTVHGKAELVIMDAAVFQKLQEKLEFENTITEINNSLAEFESKKFSSAKNTFANLKKRINKSKN